MKRIIYFWIITCFYPLLLSAQGSWTQLADCGPVGRELSSGFAIGNYGYVCGGKFQGGAYTTDLFRYDPQADYWNPKASMPFGAGGGVLFILDNRGWFTTGTTQFGGLTELYSYNPTPNVWSVLSPFPGMARSGAVAFSLQDKGYVGMGGDGGSTYFKDLYEYNTISSSWNVKASFPGDGRMLSAWFSMGTKGYVVCGSNASGFLSEVWEYDQMSNTWAQKADFPGTARVSASCFTIGNYAYMMGGESAASALLSDLWQYNPVSDSWMMLTPFPGTSRKNAASFSVGPKGYVACGSDNTTLLNDLWSFTPSGVGTGEMTAGDRLFVYPNPGKGNFTLNFNGLHSNLMNLSVLDISGKLVYQQSWEMERNQSQRSLDLSLLLPGFYLLSFEMEDRSQQIVKLVKQ
jgi:N-acetylneuraminic acid mutarotase